MVLRMTPDEFFAERQAEDTERPAHRYVRYSTGGTGSGTYNAFNEDRAFKYIMIIGITVVAIAALKYILEE